MLLLNSNYRRTNNQPADESETIRYCYSHDFTNLVDAMMTKDVALRPDYDMLLESKIMKKTAQKEGLTGSKDTRTYFNAVIEEMHQSQMIQACSPL